MTTLLGKACVVCGEPGTGYRNTAADSADVSGAHWEPRCEMHNPYERAPAGGWPQPSGTLAPLLPGESVELLPGAPIGVTIGVDDGVRGQVVGTSLEPGSMGQGVSWVTVRFDRWGTLVQVPRAYLQRHASP
jgi:hypothetical protein